MRQAFIDYNPRVAAQQIIEQANGIIDEYSEMGFTLTLRQLYYQFVARDLLANKQKNYDKLGYILNEARLGGFVDWDAIEDRTRFLRGNTHWEDPGHAVVDAARRFKIDTWTGQDRRVEVWVEKDALAGVIEPTCVELDVDFFSCRGYVSVSAMYEAGSRMVGYRKAGYSPVILHLADHDPSGIDMTRDIRDRMNMFCGEGAVEVKRIALTMAQVRKYQPPPNPTKMSDSRAPDYVSNFGNESWELDSLDPQVLAKLIKTHVTKLCDTDTRQVLVDRLYDEREQLMLAAQNWDKIAQHMRAKKWELE